MSISQSKLVLLVGPSGSGKSTWLQNQSDYETCSVISDDTLKFAFYLIDSKKEFKVDDTPIERYTKVWEHANKRHTEFQDYLRQRAEHTFKAVSQEGQTLYIDNTNLSPKVREPWIALARKYGMSVHAVEFWIDSNVLYQRLSTRIDKRIPTLLLKQQIRAQTHCGLRTEVDTVELIYE